MPGTGRLPVILYTVLYIIFYMWMKMMKIGEVWHTGPAFLMTAVM